LYTNQGEGLNLPWSIINLYSHMYSHMYSSLSINHFGIKLTLSNNNERNQMLLDGLKGPVDIELHPLQDARHFDPLSWQVKIE